MSYLSFPRINNVTAQNKLIKGIVWFLRTCFFFLEKLIRYLNRSVKKQKNMVKKLSTGMPTS